jgi:hypothetical protein
MIYTGNHSLALAQIYRQMFGESIPQDVAKAAASNGSYQQMMAGVDQATNRGQPITDWSVFRGDSTQGAL